MLFHLPIVLTTETKKKISSSNFKKYIMLLKKPQLILSLNTFHSERHKYCLNLKDIIIINDEDLTVCYKFYLLFTIRNFREPT